MGQLTAYLDTSHLRDFRSNDRTDVADWLGVDADVRLAISEVHLREWMASEPTMFLETLRWFSASFPDAVFLPSLETSVGHALTAMHGAPAPIMNVVPLANLAPLDLFHMARASLTHHTVTTLVFALNSLAEVHSRRKEEDSPHHHEYIHPKQGAFRRLVELETALEQVTLGRTALASERWKRVRAFAKDTAPTVDFIMRWDDPATTERILPALKDLGVDLRARRRRGSPDQPHWTFKHLMSQYEQQQSMVSTSGMARQWLPRLERAAIRYVFGNLIDPAQISATIPFLALAPGPMLKTCIDERVWPLGLIKSRPFQASALGFVHKVAHRRNTNGQRSITPSDYADALHLLYIDQVDVITVDNLTYDLCKQVATSQPTSVSWARVACPPKHRLTDAPPARPRAPGPS